MRKVYVSLIDQWGVPKGAELLVDASIKSKFKLGLYQQENALFISPPECLFPYDKAVLVGGVISHSVDTD